MPTGIEVIKTAGSIQVLPAAADAVSVTPSTTAWANSNYTQIVASAASDFVLLGLIVSPPVGDQFFDADIGFEVDIATGGAGSESVIATFTANHNQFFQMYPVNSYIPCSIPIDNIASGSRIAVRMRKSNPAAALTSAWKYAIHVASKPLGANITTTTNPILAAPSAADSISIAVPGTGNWSNTAYSTVIASTSSAIVLAGVAFKTPGSPAYNAELDIATGAAGAEVVVTTVKQPGGIQSPGYIPLRPLLDNIGNGVRVSIRLRTNYNTGNIYVRLAYYSKTGLGSVNNLLTTKPLKWTPSAALGITIPTNATNWVNGTYAEFVASLSANTQIAFIQPCLSSTPEKEVDLSIGASSSEVVKATFRSTWIGNNGGGEANFNAVWPIDLFPSGSRLAARARNNGSNGSGITVCSIGYYEALDAGLKTTKSPLALPSAADGISITPSNSAWGNSSWVELVSNIGADGGSIISLHFYVAANILVEYELDIGTGSAGSETVVATHRGFTQFANPTGESNKQAVFLIPYAIPANSRVAIRLRKQGTDTTAWKLGATYFATAGSPSGGGAGKGNKGGKSGGGGVHIQVPSGATYFNVGNAGVGVES